MSRDYTDLAIEAQEIIADMPAREADVLQEIVVAAHRRARVLLLSGAPEIYVESDYDAEFDIGLDATPRDCEFIPAGRYKLVKVDATEEPE